MLYLGHLITLWFGTTNQNVLNYGGLTIKMKKMDTTLKERIVCYYAVADESNKHTQQQIVNLTGYPKSTVNDCIERLLKKGIIRKVNSRMKTNIFYKKGPNYALIEGYMVPDCILLSNDLVDKTPHKAVVRTHLNGGWMSVHVIEEGELQCINFKIDPFDEKKETKILFGNSSPSYPKGLTQYTNKGFELDGEFYGIQYLKSTNGKMTLKVSPPHIVVGEKEAIDNARNNIDPFKEKVEIVLNFLQKWGGWKFETGDKYRYKITNNNIIEWGYDEEISDAIRSIVGDNFGTPGKTSCWNDMSAKADGDNGEFETNQIDVVEAIYDLPSTTRMAKDHEDRIRKLERKLGEKDDS